MRKLFKNKKGFAMAELLAVSIVLLFIFSVLFSNYLPLVAEYENRLSYNDVTAQYAAHYIRKMYKEALEDITEVGDTTLGKNKEAIIENAINTDGYFTVYKEGVADNKIFDHVLDKDNCKKIIDEYGIEEIIITKYKLNDDDGKGVKTAYTEYKGSLYNYINYLPNYEKSIYTGKDENSGDQLYRIILKTKDFGYATTPILSDYKTPGSCFVGESNRNGTLTITDYKYNGDECGENVIIKKGQVSINTVSGSTLTGEIVKIGDSAFSNEKSKNIKRITLSNEVTSIGDSAFEGSKLEEVPSLNKVVSVGKRAFANTQIKKVDLSGDRTIGDYAFANNKNLVDITLPKGNIYSDGTTLTKGLFAESGKNTGGIDVKIPGAMKEIGEEMFYLSKIKSIMFEKGVQTIGIKSFSQWDGSKATVSSITITNLDIPDSVTTIDDNSFDYLKINSVQFNLGLKKIGDYAFRNCLINKLSFANTNYLKTIGKQSFARNNIENIELPNSVTFIGDSAFSMNNNLKWVVLPSNNIDFKTISNSLFYGCGKLEEIEIPNSVTRINADAFNVTDASGASGNRLNKVLIEEENSNLTFIGERAFYGQANLSELKVPKNVTTIQNNAFGGCEKLTQINNYSSVDFTTRGCLIFYNTSTCDITKENNNVYINYLDKSQKTITNMGGVTDAE